ncbi:ThiF family adenylyltransferase [Stieleria varia]|uniref:Sulfur carrier protein ThiS adenylyltransferase n=1 Tax=Stieleria varia TaxID=2528005 RepID=A0A5C5ZNX7_9BACT|nr:ThiF family adenylyltransferase [Stieleria varia]TWT89159.1 Sulfur carrier protein ThiS adenylyltransferase [Stieleria varia]
MSNFIRRLIIPSSLWNNAYGELATGRQQIAWGYVQRSFHDHFCDLIVRHMRFGETPPSGRKLSAMDDWLLLDNPSSTGESTVRHRIEQSELCSGQWMVYLQTGLGDDHSGWIGLIAGGDQLVPLDEVRLVGPRMPVFSRAENAPPINDEPARWSRQVGALGENVFRRVHESSVLLIGAGRLGGLMGESLVRSGVQKLIVTDPDEIESHNLDATFGTRESDLGRFKTVRLVEHLNEIRPDAHLVGLTRTADDPLVLEKAKCVDLLVSCVDNPDAREQASRIAARLVKPHLDLGTIVRHRVSPQPDDLGGDVSENESPLSFDLEYDRDLGADVRLLLPGCCVRCVSAVDVSSMTSDSTLTTPQASDIELTPDWQRGGRTGSLVSLNSMAVGVAMQMWFDFLAGRINGPFWHRLRWEQGVGIQSVAQRVHSPGKCEICET